MEKLHNLLNKNVKELSLKLILALCALFIVAMGMLSYKLTVNGSYAIFTDSVAGQKTINVHYQKSGKTFSEGVIKVLKEKAEDIEDGVYFFDEDGYLDYGDGTTKINLELRGSVPKGVVSIWNKTPIYACMQYGDDNYIYTQSTKQIEERTMDCITDRSQNLVINGNLEEENNTNLTDFGTYSNGYLSKTSNEKSTMVSTDLIPVDPNKHYEVSVDMKTSDANAKYYVGIVELDADATAIESEKVSYIPNTVTELKNDLNPGDNTIYFKSLADWNTNTTKAYQRGFIFWNYEDSTGYKYPESTYSKNVYLSNETALYEDNSVDKTNNTITLTAPSGWTGPAISKDTKVSQSSSSGEEIHKYLVMNNQSITTDWDNYKSSEIHGYTQNGTDTNVVLRSQTKYIKFVILDNYSNLSNVTTYIKNISIKEVEVNAQD